MFFPVYLTGKRFSALKNWMLYFKLTYPAVGTVGWYNDTFIKVKLVNFFGQVSTIIKKHYTHSWIPKSGS